MSSTHHNDQASTNYKEAFSLFDKRGNGRVSLESLGDLLRACGQNPTLAEIRDLEKSIGGDCTNLPSSIPSSLTNTLGFLVS
jgi:Ca2+-binding EF-hand superfamily protein